MTKKAKPDFSVGGGGVCDPTFLPVKLRKELLLHLVKSPLDKQQREDLLDFCSVRAKELKLTVESLVVQQAQIQKIATNARRLLASLRAAGLPAREGIEASAGFFAYSTNPPADLPAQVSHALRMPDGNLCSSVWDWALSLEEAAAGAADAFTITRQSKPDQSTAKSYLSMIAWHVKDTTGKLPAKDRNSWFAGFAQCLCEHLDLPSGPLIVAAAIQATR